MGEIIQAKPDDASCLAALYAKAFESTGFKEFAAPERREELVDWLKGLCAGGKVWFSGDADGPIVLGHYDADKNEVVTIATRDDVEGKGYATALLNKLVALYPSVSVRPVTRGGQSVARKCGFSPSTGDTSLWVRVSD